MKNNSDKFKVGDVLKWHDKRLISNYAIIKGSTGSCYIYDIYQNGEIEYENFQADKTAVESLLYKLTKLHKALL